MDNNEFLDALSVLGFFLGWLNYKENVNQTDVQKIVNQAIQDIHEHLKIQDRKLDEILEGIRNAKN